MTEELETPVEEAPVEEVQDTEQPKEQPKEEPKHEPPEGSKRWNEVYYKMNEFKRQLEEKEQTIEAMVDHQRSLQESLDKVYDKVSSADRPDPITDPEGYDKWIKEEVKRDLKRDAPPKIEKKKPVKQDKVKQQVGMMRSLYSDFDQVTELAKDFLKDNVVKKNDILFSDNPARALYEYGIEMKDSIGKKRQKNIDSARVESGSLPPTETEITLTPEQERARKGLRISKKDYIKQLKYIQGVK